MFIRPLVAGALLSFMALDAASARPANGTNDPEIGYLKLLKNGIREVYVADEDGSGPRLLTSGRNFSSLVAGPKFTRTLLLNDVSFVRRVVWASGSGGVVVQSNSVLPISGTAGDISPNGTLLAYYDASAQAYRTFDLGTGAIRSIYPLKAGTFGNGVHRFDATGTAVLIVERNSTTRVAELIRVPLDGTPPTTTGIIDANLSTFTVATDGTIYMTFAQVGSSQVIRSFAPGDSTGSYVTLGTSPNLSCDGASLLFQRSVADGSVVILRRDLATSSEQVIVGASSFSPSGMTPC